MISEWLFDTSSTLTREPLHQQFHLVVALKKGIKTSGVCIKMNLSGDNWRGVPISEIQGSDSPWNAPEFPLVAPSHTHTVLYHLPGGGILNDRPPKPQIGKDKWDHNFVRMPCSSQSLYPIDDINGHSRLQKRWEIIENALRGPIKDSKDLADTILSYNTKFKNIWKFRALHKLFNEYLEEEESQNFFDVMLPEIAKLALALPQLIQSPIPLLKQNKNHSISLSQQQAASLLANAFFCTFPRRNSTKRTSEYASFPHINFNSLYETWGSECVMEKLKCICHYFRRVCTKVPGGVVTFSRRAAPPRSCPAWPRSGMPLASLPLHVDSDNAIEDAHGLIQLDFANKYLGGGVLGHGCVQEEIRFVICPELMLSMLFTEVLRPNEALMMIGCERYSAYSGYGDGFRWAGDYCDATPRDSSARRRVAVLAVDALPYGDVALEYRREAITRELNKAWVGLSFYFDDSSQSLQYPGVATGNWGCGAFGGSPELKSLIQMMACAETRKPMAYYTFKDIELRDEIINIYNVLTRYNVTVGQLYKYILRFSQMDVKKSGLHSFIEQLLKNGESLPHATGETSTNLELIQTELPDDIQKEFMNDSPDIFSEDDESFVQTKSPQNKQTYASEQSMRGDLIPEIKMVSPESKVMRSSINKKDWIDHDQTSGQQTVIREKPLNQTSRLFEEMQKFDKHNGKLNFDVAHTSPLNRAKNEMDAPVGREERQGDMSSDVKKRIARKITDYFGKKPM